MVQYQPHEAQLIRHVYQTITSQPWFNRNAITERELLKLILENHVNHGKDAAAFLDLCRGEAQARFSILP